MKKIAMKNTAAVLALGLYCAVCCSAATTEYTSVEEIAKDAKVLRDFQIQGEYILHYSSNKDGHDVNNKDGYTIIAEGEGQFSVAAFQGGLPGDGWQREGKKRFAKATLNSAGELVIKPEGGGSQQDIVKVADGKLGPMTKIKRESPTLGLKAPQGAVVLFDDGKASDLFTKANVNESAKTLWSEAETKPFEKRPYTLHIEFLTSYMPAARGQGRSNSGVYIDERYECQILDSFGLEGKNNECGGFYQQAEPKVNMCYPPLQWQTYDIDFAPAKYDAEGKKTGNAVISVKHNGVMIHENFEPKHETPGRKKEGVEPLGLYLQGHGNKVQFRNIWLKYKD